MTAIAAYPLSPLPPARASQLIAGSVGYLSGGHQDRFTVPESAFVEASGVPRARVVKDWRQAAGFAAMAVGELLQPIFDSVHLSAGRFGGGVGEASWKPILVAAIGESIAASGGLGLTDTVFRELIREHETAANPRPAESSSQITQPTIKGGQI